MKFTFPKKERLCRKKLIGSLFTSGVSFTVFPFRIIYILDFECNNNPLQVLFSVPKKRLKRAVQRNLVRRRAKEVFRLNKHLLCEQIPENHKLILAFVYIDDNIQSYNCIKKGVIKGVEKLSSTFDKPNSSHIPAQQSF